MMTNVLFASFKGANGCTLAKLHKVRVCLCLQYQDEEDLPLIMRLIDNELSEPYSIFTYRYFLHNWPNLCWIAYDGDQPFGTVVCKMERHREKLMRGYVAMLVVDKTFRGKGAGRLASLSARHAGLHLAIVADHLPCMSSTHT